MNVYVSNKNLIRTYVVKSVHLCYLGKNSLCYVRVYFFVGKRMFEVWGFGRDDKQIM